MSKPRELWWGYAKNVIRVYPERLGKQGRLSSIEQKEVDAVSNAIEKVGKMRSGAERLQVIDLVFWSNPKRTIDGAAIHIHSSKTTATRYHSDFVRLVGKNLILGEEIQTERGCGCEIVGGER